MSLRSKNIEAEIKSLQYSINLYKKTIERLEKEIKDKKKSLNAIQNKHIQKLN